MEDVDIGFRARVYGFKSVYCSDCGCISSLSATMEVDIMHLRSD